MNFACFFGMHDWDGCICRRCGRVRINDVLIALGGTSNDEKLDALVTLQRTGDTEVLVPAIKRALQRGMDDDTRKGASVALGVLGDPEGVSALCAALDVEKESLFLLSDVAEAMRNLADRRGIEPLVKWLDSCDAQADKLGKRSRFEALRDDIGAVGIGYGISDEQLRRINRFLQATAHADIIDALGVLRISDVTPQLIRGLQHREWQVSESAIKALGEVHPHGQQTLESLARDTDSNPERRREAVQALGASRSEDVAPFLFEVINEDSDDGVRMAAITSIGSIRCPAVMDKLVALLSASDAPSRRGAASALGDLGEVSVVGVLRQTLSDSDEQTRINAAYALADLGDDGGADVLAEAMEEQDTGIAAGFLAKLGDQRAYEPLCKGLSAKKDFDRAQACQAIGSLGGERVVSKLIPMLGDTDWHVRHAAAAGLVKLGDLRGFDVLTQGLWLSSRLSHIRSEAIDAMGLSSDPRAVAHLTRALRGALMEHRAEITEALQRLGSPAAVALIAELQDERPIVRLHAVEALGRFDGASVGAALAQVAQHDEDADVRGAAVRARS